MFSRSCFNVDEHSQRASRDPDELTSGETGKSLRSQTDEGQIIFRLARASNLAQVVGAVFADGAEITAGNFVPRVSGTKVGEMKNI